MKNLFTKTIFKKGIRTCLVTITFMLLAFGLKAQVSVTATAGTAGPTAYATLNAAFTAINALVLLLRVILQNLQHLFNY